MIAESSPASCSFPEDVEQTPKHNMSNPVLFSWDDVPAPKSCLWSINMSVTVAKKFSLYCCYTY